MRSLFLIDGNHATARSFFIPQFQAFSNRSGYKTGVIFGFLQIIKGLSRNWDPDEMIVLWDIGRSSYRHKIYSEYKATRGDYMDDGYYNQIARLQNVLIHLGVVQLGVQGVEADDLFGIITNDNNFDEFDRIVMVSSDSDLKQLIRQNRVIQYDPIKQTLIDVVVLEKEGIKPEQIIDLKALAGDSSDNVPGIRGIGDGIGKKLLQKYGSIENFDLEELKKGKRTAKIVEDYEKLALWKDIVTIFDSIEKLDEDQALAYKAWLNWFKEKRGELIVNEEKLKKEFIDLEFKWAEKIGEFIHEFGKVIRK
jgi:DNA polymerase-1